MVVKIEIFTSPTCPHCPSAIALAEEIKEEYGNKVEIEEIDVMENREKAIEYGLLAVPTIAINGEVKFVGTPSKEEFKRAIEEELKNE
ncbi:redox-active disulfide protein 1 [Methanothermus fervidus DSM 2088]|uniref:Redox-active disulfide protein 1 n=1 Tax=Methanothermus fervidus (strain ATCC 43054 / DSM 2088 / JCM 10308 / V24 S) TaxID=523846 RepID=E3GYU8_METFV|nr:MJ0307 family thioredoxin [Methanothermus fervidus]ADP77480.1 redox-active disulfide protein 1 [Methanothermus fervidus DSM 2088]